jgi:hypothetical protein
MGSAGARTSCPPQDGLAAASLWGHQTSCLCLEIVIGRRDARRPHRQDACATALFTIHHYSYLYRGGVGRGAGVERGLGVGVGLGVAVAVAVGVGVGPDPIVLRIAP